MKKALVLFLALLMIVSSFVACNPSDDNPSGESTKAPGSNNPSASSGSKPESDPEDSETELQIGNLDPSIKIEREITIISRSHPWFSDEVSVDSTDGDPIDDAIFQRNLDVERILGCTLVNFPVSESESGDYAVVTQIKNTLGPDCPYDIMSASAYTAFENTAAGICQNLLNIGNIDLDQNYWAPYYNDAATIGHQQYFATGAISLSLRRMIFVTFFNKRLANQYGLDDLYQVVNDGDWTLEYQSGIIANMYSDVDDEEGLSEGDFFGLVTNKHICVDPYWAACDVQIMVKDKEEDFFSFAPELQKLDTILENLKEIYYESGATYAYVGLSGDTDQDKIRAKFTSGQATMATLRLLEVEADDFRNMEDAYGILPMPKYDKEQKEYYSHAHDQFAVYGVVGSVPSTEVDEIGAVLECMAIEGYRTVTPAYYEVALKGKYSKDEESWDMLDKIVSNLKIDGGLLYTIKLNDITQQLRNAVKNQSATISATIFGNLQMNALNRKLNAMQDAIKEMQG